MPARSRAERGYKISATEIRYRMQGARTYKTETEIANAIGDFSLYRALRQAVAVAPTVCTTGTPVQAAAPHGQT